MTVQDGDVLATGAFGTVELIPWGSNYTFVARLEGGHGETLLAVYKPRRGEVPLRDFPNGTLYRREVAAYVLSEHLRWNIVPRTIVREDGPHGIGSLQRFVEPEESPIARYDRLRQTHRAELQRMAAFDLLANNADRKGAHCLLDRSGHLWGIDHGLTFHQVPKLRTVIWDFCEEPIPDALVQQLWDLRSDAARHAALLSALAPYLAPGELEALVQRWDRLLERPCYPRLDPYRNVPWPPF